MMWTEREKYIAFYREMIDDRIEDGSSEQEAVASLEDVLTISNAILSDPENKDKLKVKPSALTITLLILGFPLWFPLLVTAAVLILSLYIVIWSLIIVIFSVILTFAVGGIVGCVTFAVKLFSGSASAIFVLGAGFILLALSILLLFPALLATKYLASLTVRIWKGIFSRILKKAGNRV